jgi:hypothetical protein
MADLLLAAPQVGGAAAAGGPALPVAVPLFGRPRGGTSYWPPVEYSPNG